MEQENNINSEECLELKNIKYKTMLLNGNPLKETKSENDLSNLDKFLEDEKNNNVNEPWCKLNKTIKTKKILEFVEKYKSEKNLDQEEEKVLLTFLKFIFCASDVYLLLYSVLFINKNNIKINITI